MMAGPGPEMVDDPGVRGAAGATTTTGRIVEAPDGGGGAGGRPVRGGVNPVGGGGVGGVAKSCSSEYMSFSLTAHPTHTSL